MPYEVANGYVLEVRLLQEMNSQTLLNVRHYELSQTGATDGVEIIEEVIPTLQNDANDWGWIGRLYQFQNAAVKYKRLSLQWIWPTRYASVDVIPDAAEGLVAGAPLPQNIQASLTFRPETAVPRRVGGMRIGGLSDDMVNAGLIAPVPFSSLTLLAEAAIAPVILTGVERQLNPVVFNASSSPAALRIYNGFAQTQARVMVRRTVGRGI